MDDYSQPARDEYQDWQDTVDRDWIIRERLDRLDEQHEKDEPPDDE